MWGLFGNRNTVKHRRSNFWPLRSENKGVPDSKYKYTNSNEEQAQAQETVHTQNAHPIDGSKRRSWGRVLTRRSPSNPLAPTPLHRPHDTRRAHHTENKPKQKWTKKMFNWLHSHTNQHQNVGVAGEHVQQPENVSVAPEEQLHHPRTVHVAETHHETVRDAVHVPENDPATVPFKGKSETMVENKQAERPKESWGSWAMGLVGKATEAVTGIVEQTKHQLSDFFKKEIEFYNLVHNITVYLIWKKDVSSFFKLYSSTNYAYLIESVPALLLLIKNNPDEMFNILLDHLLPQLEPFSPLLRQLFDLIPALDLEYTLQIYEVFTSLKTKSHPHSLKDKMSTISAMMKKVNHHEGNAVNPRNNRAEYLLIGKEIMLMVVPLHSGNSRTIETIASNINELHLQTQIENILDLLISVIKFLIKFKGQDEIGVPMHSCPHEGIIPLMKEHMRNINSCILHEQNQYTFYIYEFLQILLERTKALMKINKDYMVIPMFVISLLHALNLRLTPNKKEVIIKAHVRNTYAKLSPNTKMRLEQPLDTQASTQVVKENDEEGDNFADVDEDNFQEVEYDDPENVPSPKRGGRSKKQKRKKKRKRSTYKRYRRR